MRSTRSALITVIVSSALGCSAPAEPPPFEEVATFRGRLAADLACPVYVDTQGGRTFVAAQGATRVVAAPNEASVGEAVRDWVRGYASDFGFQADSIKVAGEARGPGGMLHIVLSTGLPDSLAASGYGLDVTLDQQGRLLGATSHSHSNVVLTPSIELAPISWTASI
jgi:hypothetical protein